MRRDPGPSYQPARIAAWIALLAHLAFGAFPYGLTGLLAPMWGVAVVYAYWLGLFGAWLWLSRVRPAWCLAVPAAALVGWIVILSAGDVLLGWSA